MGGSWYKYVASGYLTENHGKPSVGLGFYHRTKWKRYLRHWKIAGWFFKADDHSFAMTFFNACGPGPCFWSIPDSTKSKHQQLIKRFTAKSQNKSFKRVQKTKINLSFPWEGMIWKLYLYMLFFPAKELVQKAKGSLNLCYEVQEVSWAHLGSGPSRDTESPGEGESLGTWWWNRKGFSKIKQRFLHTLHWNKHYPKAYTRLVTNRLRLSSPYKYASTYRCPVSDQTRPSTRPASRSPPSTVHGRTGGNSQWRPWNFFARWKKSWPPWENRKNRPTEQLKQWANCRNNGPMAWKCVKHG